MEWANGTHSNSRIDPGGKVTIDLRDSLTVASTLTITPTSGSWKWYPANQTGNMVFYRNAIANVSYTDWDTILKEQIVLTAPVSAISWQLNLSMRPQTLTVTTDGDDYLIKSPAYGDGWIRVRLPFVVDANGVKRNLRYTWNNGQRRLTLVQDFSGLTYPLTIDPVYLVESRSLTSPMVRVNQSGYAYIVYSNSSSIKIAVNTSGPSTGTSSWSLTTVPMIGTPYQPGRLWFDFDENGLPIIMGLDGSSTPVTGNVTTWSGGKWVNGSFTTDGSASWPSFVYNKTTKIFTGFYMNNTEYLWKTTANFNTIPLSFTSTPYGVGSNARTGRSSSRSYAIAVINSSLMIHVFYRDGSATNLNLTIFDGTTVPPLGSDKIISAAASIASVYVSSIAAINPAGSIDIPSVAYGAVTPQYQGNFSYFGSSGKLYHEMIWANGTSVTRYNSGSLAFNSSGKAYSTFQDAMSGNPFLALANRSGANSWSNVTISESGASTGQYSSITIDPQDNIHIAFGHNNNLYYYFEPLPAAAGAAPVAAFSCTPLTTVRNGTITCTDASTNTPTSWDWYSPDSQQQVLFSGNITNQNPNFFPHKLGGYFSVNLIATNAFGTSTKASGSRYIWVQKPLV